MSDPAEASVFVMDPLAFAKYCADDIARFHSDLFESGDLIPKAETHRTKLPCTPDGCCPLGGGWIIAQGSTSQFLVMRCLVDTREELVDQLNATEEAARDLLKEHKARYAGAVLVYPGVNVDFLRFDVALVIPFWTREQGEADLEGRQDGPASAEG